MSVAQGTTRVPPRVRNNDVTPAINAAELGIGGSNYTGQHSQSASQSLQYIEGPTLQRPSHQQVLSIPMVQRWEDAVGLFGAENKFIRYDIKYDKKWALKCYEDDGYECLNVTYLPRFEEGDYDMVRVVSGGDGTLNTYEDGALIRYELPTFANNEDVYVSVELKNNKTGNIYNDAHVDARLYTKDRLEWPHSKGYIRYNEWFYVGFHARETRRLPLDMTVVVGDEYKSTSMIDQRLIMRPFVHA